MSKQRYIDTSFWQDSWVQDLDPSQKYMYLYFMTNPMTNIAGVYEISLKQICFDTGYNSDTVSNIIRKFEESKKLFYFENHIILRNFPKHQLTSSQKVLKGIVDILKELPKDVFEYLPQVGYELDVKQAFDTLSIPLPYPLNYLNLNLNINSNLNLYTPSETENTVSEKPKTESKHKFGEYQNVLLSDAEYSKFVSEFGEETTKGFIQNFSELKYMKGYKYKSDYLALKKWGIESYFHPKQQNYQTFSSSNKNNLDGKDTL